MQQKYVDLRDLLAGAGFMTTSAARRLAHDMLDACEAVDPTEEEGEWERHAAQQDREYLAEREAEMDAEHERLVAQRQAGRRAAAGVDEQAWRSEVMRMGFEVREPSPHHVQVRRSGKVLAEWWPSKGTTMSAQQRGPRCADAAAFLRWLRGLV